MKHLHNICSRLIILLMIIYHLSIDRIFSLSDCLFFCRLKINHDSHEFILEFGTVANRYALSLVSPVFAPIAPVSVAMLVSSVSMSRSLPLFLFSSLCLCYLLNVIGISEGHTAMVHPRHVHRSVQISH
jgi:hypothetical protein